MNSTNDPNPVDPQNQGGQASSQGDGSQQNQSAGAGGQMPQMQYPGNPQNQGTPPSGQGSPMPGTQGQGSQPNPQDPANMYPQMPGMPTQGYGAPMGGYMPQGGMGGGMPGGMNPGMMGGMNPGMGMTGGGFPPPPPPTEPVGDPNYRFGEHLKNFKTTVKLPAHSLTFDELHFIKLLAGSISLSRDEKKKILDAIPKLRQEQIDELISILEEEKEKFLELSPKHSEQLKQLEKKYAADWAMIEDSSTLQTKKQEDEQKAEEIRKQLGL